MTQPIFVVAEPAVIAGQVKLPVALAVSGENTFPFPEL